MSGQQDFSNSSMLELFRMEVETHSAVLNDGLVAVAGGTAGPELLEALMRAAHSIKGAASIVGLQYAVTVAHAMEDCFVAAQQGKIVIPPEHAELLLQGADYLLRSSGDMGSDAGPQAAAIVSALKNFKAGAAAPTKAQAKPPEASPAPAPVPAPPPVSPIAVPAKEPPAPGPERGNTQSVARDGGRAVRVNAASLSRLMGLAGEVLVDAGWLTQFERSLRDLQTQHQRLGDAIERLQSQQSLVQSSTSASLLHELQQQNSEYQHRLADRVSVFEAFSLRSDNRSHRLYREVIASRMRPFGDSTHSFPRLVHDVARTLDKKVLLEVSGKETEVDRDILEKLDAPLNHLLRNAVDHGMESPAERRAAGKHEQGRIVLEAMHKGGMLFVSVTDDGRGIEVERVRRKIVERKLASPEMSQNMTEAEVLEFLFLPGFSTAEKVTEISGRGVGLDVVQTMIQEVSGQIRVTTRPGQGCAFHLQLPITLSVLSVLLVEIAGDPYAFPLARIDKVLKLEKSHIESLENRQYFKLEGANVGLVPAQQILETTSPSLSTGELPVVVIGGRNERYGLAVDRVLGERKVVVRPLDVRLGKIPNISAASLMEDGSPLLIVDIEDMMQSIHRLLTGGGRIDKVLSQSAAKKEIRKRVLIVDDSLTVREVERKLLANRGYHVEVAIDGAEGWNALRSSRFDLVITDVDMPRMNGIELVTRIRADARYKTLPIMIVSYKDRESDRMKGMEAGANYYLTKSSFHDESLLVAVVELIGEPR